MNISGPAAVAKPEMLFYAPGDLTVTQNRSDISVRGLPFFEIISEHTIKFILPKFACIGIIALYKIDI